MFHIRSSLNVSKLTRVENNIKNIFLQNGLFYSFLCSKNSYRSFVEIVRTNKRFRY